MEMRRDYEKPESRVSEVAVEAALLTGSTDPLPIDPFDPEFD